MSRPATSRLKVNPPLGRMPVLQFMAPAELQVDASYQRSLESGNSQSLIRKIAQFWNWDLCQPLVVARRSGGDLFVIDGQHRLEAARMRGDIANLPCVVVDYASAADEAASFVHLNQQRRPLSKLDVFKAAVASEDPEACAILAALSDAGLSVAGTTNSNFWKPGQLVNIGGIERGWRVQGPTASRTALRALGSAFSGQVLKYAGTIYPGIVVVCADELKATSLGSTKWTAFLGLLGGKSQADWRNLIYGAHAETPNLSRREAAERVLRAQWAEVKSSLSTARAPEAQQSRSPSPPPPSAPTPSPVTIASANEPDGKRWCEQCDRRVSLTATATCRDRFCKLRPRLRA